MANSASMVSVAKHGSSASSTSSYRSHAPSSDPAVSRTTSLAQIETGSENSIRVVVRVRPLNVSEVHREDKASLEYPEKSVLWVNVQGATKPFTFNTIFGDTASQTEVFEQCGIKDLIEKALDGFSCTAFAFGQTGSGKTYTITGPFYPESNESSGEFVYGLIPRSFEYLLSELEKRKESYVIKTSYLEVYNEKVKDLLNPSRALDSLPVRWSSTNGFYVDNVFKMECENLADMMVVLEEGLQNRQVGTHAMNDHSSRSHTLLTVYLNSEMVDSDDDVPINKYGKISFVDLAGSERVKETKPTGEALAESQNINKSLLTLGNCIAALGDPKKRGGHIPYRESKLTKLLADSIGGDGYTLMIACISPSSSSVQDTLNTLRYANRAKNIRNKPVIKMDPKEQLIMSMKREIKLLKAENVYFRQQLNVPCSDSQVVITPSQIKGQMSSDEHSGFLSPAIGTSTLSSIQPSTTGSLSDIEAAPRANTAMFAMNASIGLYDMLQEYMNENETLRQQNFELFKSRKEVEKEHEVLTMQNDSLILKIGSIERVLSSTSLSVHSDDTITISEERSHGSILQEEELYSSKLQRSGFSFPPLHSGTYPNIISSSVDLAAEVEKEHKKIKEERARIAKQSQERNEIPVSAELQQKHSPQDLNDTPIQFNREKSDSERNTEFVVQDNLDVSQKRATDASGNLAEKRPNVKQKGLKKKAAVERDKAGNSYAAKFAVRKGFTATVPHKPEKEVASNRNDERLNPPADKSLRNQFHTSGLQIEDMTDSMNEKLRQDLEQLEGQIRNEVAFSKKSKPRYHAR